MEVKLLHETWRLEPPGELVKQAGLSAGEVLKCQAFSGGLAFTAPGVSFSPAADILLPAEKKTAPLAGAFLFRLFPVPAGRGTAVYQKRQGQGTAGTAGL